MRLAIVCLPGLLIGLALSGCDRQNASPPQGNAAETTAASNAVEAPHPTGRLDRSHAGTAAPDLAFEDGEGRPTRLSAFRGRPLLVNFWATWCGPCIAELPSLDALAGRESDRLQVVTVSQDSDSGESTARQKVSDFFAARRFQRLQPLLDSQMGLMGALQLDTLPTTILYDAEGREVWRMTGAANWAGEREARLLREGRAG